MNQLMIKEKEFITTMEKELEVFFHFNHDKTTTIHNIWETTKAYIRGISIAYSAKRNKEKRAKIDTLTQELNKLESKLQENPLDTRILEELNTRKHKINLLTQEELAKKLKGLKQNFFESANKPGRWLAHKIAKQKLDRNIDTLIDSEGKRQMTNENKKDVVYKFYTELYSQEKVNEDTIRDYLSQSNLPSISEEDSKMLNGKITLTELRKVIDKQKNNKTPGPDGIPFEVYKKIQNPLDSIMLELFNEIIEKGNIPETWKEAYITLIPKDKQNKDQIQNYRPISLLNTDYKIFAAILAERLKRILNKFIHSDQNGFLPQRHIKNNMRTLLNAIEYYDICIDKQVAFIFIDAQKAFDNLNWRYFINQLEMMNFGENFITIIKGIYAQQTAKIVINRDLTNKINIKKGVRQGCPLAPLIFILALETLLRNIRSNPTIRGLKVKKEEYKLLAFADDMAFIIEDPLNSAQILIKEIERFGKVAGLKINKGKTKIITKNMTPNQNSQLEGLLGIDIVRKAKYLGIVVSARCSTLKKDNYDTLIQKITKDLDLWTRLQLSLMGKISLIKMNILPKVIFLFQTIPIKLNKTFFTTLNKIIHKFIWLKRKARIKLKLMQDHRTRGGMGLPDWEIYYKAALLSWTREWILLRDKRTLTLQGFDLYLGWHAFLMADRDKKLTYFKRHYIRKSLIESWIKIRNHYYIQMPRWFAPREAETYPTVLPPGKPITYEVLLDEEDQLLSKDTLQKKGLNIDWFQYFQIRSRYIADKVKRGFQKMNILDKLMFGPDKQIISSFYKFLLQQELVEEEVKGNMVAWAQNFGHTITLIEWNKIWTQNYKLTLATSYRENIYKMFYRWHLPPARLSKMFPTIPPTCWKCKQKIGTYYHLWWTCPNTRAFWLKIQKYLEQIIQKPIPLKPELFLLGIIRHQIDKEDRYLLINILTAARIIFAQNWKSDRTPTTLNFINKTMECAELTKMTLELQDKEESEFYKSWDKWYNWLSKKEYKTTL